MLRHLGLFLFLPWPAIALATAAPPLHADWFDGGDLSALAHLEKHGTVFRDASGKPADCIKVMAAQGANCVRLRLFVDPTDKGFVVNSLDYTLALAKRAKAANCAVMLDFHYSDTWADPGHQIIPRSWPQDSLPALEKKIEAYTFETLRRFDKEGVFPELVQIGNEIENGILWPVGKVWLGKGKPPNHEPLLRLLKAASRGVRRATPQKSRTRIIVHSATGGLVDRTANFHQHLKGLDFDVVGLSYYPWWHGTLEGLRDNCRNVQEKFGKEVLVVEAGFPWRVGGKHTKWAGKTYPWPYTPDGQKQFLSDVIDAVASTPDSKGIGVIWWHPDAIETKGLKVWHSGSAALFTPDGKPLPAQSSFRRH